MVPGPGRPRRLSTTVDRGSDCFVPDDLAGGLDVNMEVAILLHVLDFHFGADQDVVFGIPRCDGREGSTCWAT